MSQSFKGPWEAARGRAFVGAHPRPGVARIREVPVSVSVSGSVKPGKATRGLNQQEPSLTKSELTHSIISHIFKLTFSRSGYIYIYIPGSSTLKKQLPLADGPFSTKSSI